MEFILTVILIFFVVTFLGRLFFRYVLPWWLSRFIKKQQKRYGQQFYYNEKSVNEDEKIRYKQEDIKGDINPDVGEYVDFEEVDEDEEKNKP